MDPYANGNSFSSGGSYGGTPDTLPPLLYPPPMRDRDLPRYA
jgi:hypothetical protein